MEERTNGRTHIEPTRSFACRREEMEWELGIKGNAQINKNGCDQTVSRFKSVDSVLQSHQVQDRLGLGAMDCHRREAPQKPCSASASQTGEQRGRQWGGQCGL